MRKVNVYNKILISTTISLLIVIIYRVIQYNPSARFYYTQSASAPPAFPIHILTMWFNIPDDDYVKQFYNSEHSINTYLTDWGFSTNDNAHSRTFIPSSLYLQYIDFRSQRYYIDTIPLPREKIIDIFKWAKRHGKYKNLTYYGSKMGLEFHVGIANDGQVIFWLLGNDYEREFYRVKLTPKDFNTYIKSHIKNLSPPTKEEYIKRLFENNIPDSIKQILRTAPSTAQYKDSIPKHFKHLQNNP